MFRTKKLILKSGSLKIEIGSLVAVATLKDALTKEAVREVDSEPGRKEGRHRVGSVPGVGRVIGASLALTFDKVAFTCVDSFIAYLGDSIRGRQTPAANRVEGVLQNEDQASFENFYICRQ